MNNYYNTKYDYTKDLEIDWKRMNHWLDWIDDLLLHNTKMLDIGCGIGRTSQWAEKRKIIWMGIESSERAISIGNGVFDRSIDYGNAEDLPYPTSYFDYVVCLGSLEHMHNQNLVLHELQRVCRQDGKIIILVPNRMPILDWLHFNYGTEQEYEIKRTKEEWSDMLQFNSIKIHRIRRDYGPKIFKNFKPLGLIKRLMLKLTKILPHYFTYCWIFDCTPIKEKIEGG